MAVTATGSLSIPLHQLRTMLLASTSWQTWAGSLILATAQTYLVEAPEDALFPHAVIDLGTDQGATRDGCSTDRFTRTGGAVLYICDDVASSDVRDNTDILTEFMNRADAVMAEIEKYPPGGGMPLALNGWSMLGLQRMIDDQRDKHGDILEAAFSLTFAVWP